ncbi:MAG: amidohydrolase [Candidatus Hodarchaeota archaeon]
MSEERVGIEEFDFLIRNCTVLPIPGQIIENGMIGVDGNRISYVGKVKKGAKGETEVDGENMIAMPGLINCHTHVPMTIFRGVAEDKNAGDWFNEIIWPLEEKLSPDDIYWGTLLGCLEMIRSGTTCFSDMYYMEDKVARAVEGIGIRGVLALGVIENGDKKRGEQGLKAGIDFIRKYNKSANGRIRTWLGPHAPYTVSPELLKRFREEADRLGVGLHIHLAELLDMKKLVKDKYGTSPVRFLDSLGFLKGDVLAAHCIHISDEELKILVRRDVKIAYNPISNMKIAAGIARIYDLLKSGAIVGIGTDSAASNNSLDMFQTMKFAALLQKINYMNPEILPIDEILGMATIGGARALGLEKEIGSLQVGKIADIILVNTRKPHLTPSNNHKANLVYSANGADIDTVIIDGRIVMINRQVTTVDEEEVMQRASRTIGNLLSD